MRAFSLNGGVYWECNGGEVRQVVRLDIVTNDEGRREFYITCVYSERSLAGHGDEAKRIVQRRTRLHYRPLLEEGESLEAFRDLWSLLPEGSKSFRA